jgi:hypothetical protein
VGLIYEKNLGLKIRATVPEIYVYLLNEISRNQGDIVVRLQPSQNHAAPVLASTAPVRKNDS